MATDSLRRVIRSRQEWKDLDPVVPHGTMAVEEVSTWFKIGDGRSRWSQLRYFKPASESASGVPATLTEDVGYDVVPLLGQSNLMGYGGEAVDALVDITSPQIWTFGATGARAGQIVRAADPLAHRQGNANFVGPGMEFARWYSLRTQRRILLVPAGYAGTAFGSGTPNWDTATPDGSTSLYNLAVSQTEAALAAAGPNSRLLAVLWVQGESDAYASLSGAEYRTHLEALIDGFRDRLDAPSLPFVIGSMLPEFITNGSGAPTRAAIDLVHRQTPTRKAYTSFVESEVGFSSGDDLHYSAEGSRALGRSMVEGLDSAKANVAPSDLQPVAPPAYVPPADTGSDTEWSDDFARADSSTLGTSSSGHSWTSFTPANPVRVFNGGATFTTTGVLSSAGIILPDAGGDGVLSATIVNIPASDPNLLHAGFVFRASDGDNMWIVGFDGAMYKIESAAVTVHNAGPGGLTYTVGDVISLEVEGLTATLKRNGTTVATHTLTTLNQTVSGAGPFFGGNADGVGILFGSMSYSAAA